MCTTCQQTMLFCPGHFGKIELPLPVINPLFSKTLLSIFRMSCLGCHNVTIPGVIFAMLIVLYIRFSANFYHIFVGVLKYMCLAQLKLLSFGYMKEAQDAESVIGDILVNDGETKKKSKYTSKAEIEVARLKFEAYVESVLLKCSVVRFY